MKINLSPSDVEITFVRGSGPGGQNRNKRWTGVRARHLPTGIVVMATERRNQSQNLAMAFERLEERVRKALATPRLRQKTRVSRQVKRRRLELKRQHGHLKKGRRDNVMMDDE